MDKYDQVARMLIAKAEPDEQAEVAAVVNLAMEVARSLEQLGSDIDRIAHALEKLAK